jgi:hypothetical protein
MIFITKSVVCKSLFIFSDKIWQTIGFDILVVLLFKKLIIFVVVDYCWSIIAAQNLATRYLLHQLREYRGEGPVPSLKELSFQELIDCYCPKKKHVYKYYYNISFWHIYKDGILEMRDIHLLGKKATANGSMQPR